MPEEKLVEEIEAALRGVPDLCIERHYGFSPCHQHCLKAPDIPEMARAVLAVVQGRIGELERQHDAIERNRLSPTYQYQLDRVEALETALRNLVELARHRSPRRPQRRPPNALVPAAYL